MCNSLCRCALVIVNLAGGFVGAAITVVGALLVWGKQFLSDQMKHLIVPLLEKLYGEKTSQDLDGIVTKLLQTTAPIGLTLFIFGAIIVGICAFGCCGGCFDSTLLLKIYIALLGVVVLVSGSALVFYFARKELVTSLVKQGFTELLKGYKSISANDTSSMVFSLMMPPLNCCGIHNGEDFKNVSFDREIVYGGQKYILEYPVPCCKMDTNYKIIYNTCPREFREDNSNIYTGCWPAISNFVVHYGDIAAYVGLVVIILLLMLITVAAVTIALN